MALAMLQQLMINIHVILVPKQVGASPDHIPSIWQFRCGSPLIKNPLSQLYVATEPTVLMDASTLPFSGADREAQRSTISTCAVPRPSTTSARALAVTETLNVSLPSSIPSCAIVIVEHTPDSGVVLVNVTLVGNG